MPKYLINVIHNFILPDYLKNLKKILDIWRGIVDGMIYYFVVYPFSNDTIRDETADIFKTPPRRTIRTGSEN